MTDQKLTEEQLAIFDDAAISDLSAIIEQQDFGSQAQVFTIPEEEGQLEVEVMKIAGNW